MSDVNLATIDTMTDMHSFGTDLDADNLASPLQEHLLYSPDCAPHDRLPHHPPMYQQQSAPAGFGDQHSSFEGTDVLISLALPIYPTS